jgi:hypothetical protein
VAIWIILFRSLSGLGVVKGLISGNKLIISFFASVESPTSSAHHRFCGTMSPTSLKKRLIAGEESPFFPQ